MTHAAEIEKAATANNMEGVAAHRKELGGVCQTCHKANREKTETGFADSQAATDVSPIYLTTAAIAIATPPSVSSVTSA